ncbi:MAG TPA: ATP-binding protein [Usitatibacter sp.]|nr:ATP-binding protein [Usitatibacter sp.]
MQQASRAHAGEAATARAALDSITFGVAVLDRDGTIVTANRSWERFIDLNSPTLDAARTGGNYLALLRGMAASGNSFAKAGIAALQSVIRRELRLSSLEHELRVQGRVRWFLARATPLEGSAGGVVVTHLDITPRVVSHLALEQAHARLRQLSARLAEAEERQRQAIALELHDDVCQSLASVAIGLRRLPPECGAEGAELLAECVAVLDQGIAKLHGLSGQLGAPELDHGMAAALEALVRQLRQTSGRRIDIRNPPLPIARPRRAVALACYRIAQEALNNAVRHGNASEISVSVDDQGGLLRLHVRDNGVGLDPSRARRKPAARPGHGMQAMTERARLAGGQLRVRSAPGLGTSVTAVFPLPRKKHR